MTATDELKRRAARYHALAPAAAVLGVTGLVIAFVFWMPWPGAGPVFRHVQIDWHLQTWWCDHVARTHSADDIVRLFALRSTTNTIALVLGLVGAALSLLRRRGLGAAVIALALSITLVPQAIGRRDAPEIYAEAPELTPASAARLDALVRTPQGQAAVYRQILYPAGSKPGDGPIGWGSLDDFSAASVAPELHYILAQRAYLASDAAQVQAQLNAIDLGHLPLTYDSAYRLNVMRDWVAGQGRPAFGSDIETPFPSIPVAWQRPLSWGGLGLAVMGGGIALAGLALAQVLRRRLGRIDTYTARLQRIAA